MMETTYQMPILTAQDMMHEIHNVARVNMDVSTAADLLNDLGVIPVVDSRGRCIGLFTAADHQRWIHDSGSVAGVVRDYMTTQFSVATPDMNSEELWHRLETADEPFLIVLDRQARPRGIVLALDILAATRRPARRRRVYSLAN